MKNLNLLFNKTYYLNLGNESFANDVKKYNYDIINTTFDKKSDYKKSEVASHTFPLKVAYPGLLVGIGNLHGAHMEDEKGKKITDDINIGFTFDYVTGQPIIPGSTVKGVLRSCLENNPEVVGAFFKVNITNELIKELFEGDDAFLDAVILCGDENNKILAFDTITPHKSPIENPIPIKFIKVTPDVQFEFRFRLTDGILTAKEKADLYKELIMLFGIGAKTNVGYGVMLDSCIPAPQAKNQVECPNCKAINNKYTKSGSLNPGWINKKCYKCGKRLDI